METLRLAGAPGVGKSTTAWSVARRLSDDGVATAYIDTDQLGMCYPAPDDDLDRWALKERALAAMAEEFSRAGTDRLVVSGVAWPDDRPPQIGGTAVRSLWLDASVETRRTRLLPRGFSDEQLESTLSAGTAEAARVHPDWERIDTDGRTAAETVEDVLARWQPRREGTTPGHVGPRTRTTGTAAADRVLWITGPRLAGASRIGWEIVTHEWREGRRAGFIDLAQLSFTWNIDEPVGMANLVGLHTAFHDIGSRLLVVVAPVEADPAAAREALPTSDTSFLRLAPSDTDIRRNADFRRRGDGPTLAGDDVVGAADAAIALVVAIADAQSSLPLRPYENRVDTRGRSVDDAAAAVRRAADW